MDGTGSFLVHIGSSTALADISHDDVVHVIVCTGTYGSTGNQPLMFSKTNLVAMFEGLSYKEKVLVDHAEILEWPLYPLKRIVSWLAVNNTVRESRPCQSGTSRMWMDTSAFFP